MFPTRNGMMMCYAIRAYSITFNGMKKSSTKYLKVTLGYPRCLCYYDTNATNCKGYSMYDRIEDF